MSSAFVQGVVRDGFERVREAFEANFADYPEVGAAVAVVRDGETVVDLWAGHADRERKRAWQRDTIVNVWSTTKGITALAAHMLVDRGKLDLDAPVARYWPEFAAAGKEALPVRYLLTHEAGLAALAPDLPAEALLDWDAVVRSLAAQAPAWEPGTKQGYHGLTFGWLVGEVMRRVSGQSVGSFVRSEIAEPLGIDCYIGIGAELDPRVADILRDERPEVRAPADAPARPSPLRQLDWNSRVVRAAEIPAANGHTNARALARIYGALARGGEIDGVRLLSPESVERAAQERANGVDATLGVPTHRTLGFMRRFEEFDDVRPASSFGHSGAGGSQGFADPEARLGFGYTMNRMLMPLPGESRPPTGGMDPRGQRLVRALYDAAH